MLTGRRIVTLWPLVQHTPPQAPPPPLPHPLQVPTPVPHMGNAGPPGLQPDGFASHSPLIRSMLLLPLPALGLLYHRFQTARPRLAKIFTYILLIAVIRRMLPGIRQLRPPRRQGRIGLLISCMMLMLTLNGLTTGEQLLRTTNPNTHHTHRTKALNTCALAMITLATHKGIVNRNNGEIKWIMHVKADIYDFVLTEILGTESIGKHWLGYPQSMDCRGEGTVIIQVRCTQSECQNEQTGERLTEKEAESKVKLLNSRRKRDLEKLKTSRWDTNMFQQWIMYSAKSMFEASQRKKQDCIACYNAKKLPQIQGIPGGELGGCPDITKCFALCAMHMAGGLPPWDSDKKVCPTFLSDDNYDVVKALPPVVHKPPNNIFPFCIARGQELEEVVQRGSPKLSDTGGLVRCSRIDWYPKLTNGNTTATIKLCETGPKAQIQCKQIVPNGGAVIYERNSSHIAQYSLLDLTDGTRPLGDVFWICEGNDTLMLTLPPSWEGICAPLMLTGQLSLIIQRVQPNQTSPRKKRDTQDTFDTWDWDWKATNEIYITWDQVPYGVPEGQVAIGSGWIKAGRGAGSVPIYGSIANAQYIARNSRWINYLWYNQQRFMNYTVKGLSLVREQLHATSMMALQNRFVIESRMAGDQGICDEIGEDCCTLIPMHTGANGSLTGLLNEMRKMRDEHVRNSNWNTQVKSKML
ncbi:uncharacterized protein isoform X1 [Takifugu rubripes]|uniref:uncharacterized protein isoform X1 n=1 Tax=Takifugu rubripes TaxID=31033 RepID=UPI0011456093|nr:uncharacterized protein LOC115249614 isoform X1 [Takifugu rubripes]XP_029691388.1 uncharacterized protein LOC115249614 isoform X1 [Takifugu rubripes]